MSASIHFEKKLIPQYSGPSSFLSIGVEVAEFKLHTHVAITEGERVIEEFD